MNELLVFEEHDTETGPKRLDLSTHAFRVFRKDGVLIGHMSCAHAAASHLLIVENMMPKKLRGGWVARPDGTTFDSFTATSIQKAGVAAYTASLARENVIGRRMAG